MWLQPGENTVDCKISYSVAASTDVLRLQKKVAKPSMCVIATFSQCDCTLSAVWLQKKTVTRIACDCDWKNSCKKHVKKYDCKKPVQKKATCHDTVRLRLGWCLLDVVVTLWQYRWLQHPLQCGCNHWCAAIAKKTVANPAWGWLQLCRSVIATL
jgi:hypothetical protein